jgi:hypothetical protein
MHTLVASNEAIAIEVTCSLDALTVELDDGRTITVPLQWFPRLLGATDRQKKRWEFIGGGIGIHWDEIDEDISVASLLNPERFMLMAQVVSEPSPRLKRKSNPRRTARSAQS